MGEFPGIHLIHERQRLAKQEVGKELRGWPSWRHGKESALQEQLWPSPERFYGEQEGRSVVFLTVTNRRFSPSSVKRAQLPDVIPSNQ